MKMCEMTLDQTGLTRKQGAEITEHEFDAEWGRHGGTMYLQSVRNQVSSQYLKNKIASQIMSPMGLPQPPLVPQQVYIGLPPPLQAAYNPFL